MLILLPITPGKEANLGSSLAVLEIVRGHETSPAVFTHYLCLPPAVVLEAEDGENIALCEGEFFGDLCGVQVHGSRCAALH